MKLLGIRVKSIWAVLLHFNTEVISLLKCSFVCPGTIQKIWGSLPDSSCLFIWKIFQRLNWQNSIYQSSTDVLLIIFILINTCKPKKSAPGQMKPLTCNEILQFLILAGRKRNPSVFNFSWAKKKIYHKLIQTNSHYPLPQFFLFHGPVKDGLFTQTHLRIIPILLESLVFFHGCIFSPLKLMLPNSSAHELFAVQITTILFQIKNLAAAGKKGLWEHQSVEHIFELGNLSGSTTDLVWLLTINHRCLQGAVFFAVF